MEYEWLLRRVCNCGRNYNNGADADIYRKMERAYNALTMAQIIKREDAEDQYHSAFAVVRRYVNKALEEGMNQIKYQASNQIKYQASNSDRQQIQELSNNLDFDYFDKQELDEIIQQANDIFHKYGL